MKYSLEGISHDTDILVIGSGAAGLTLALRAATFARVAVISKGSLREGATFYAQGGIAAVLDDNDSVDAHVADTLVAGVGLCHEDMVRFVVRNSRECVRWLVDQGVPFTTKKKSDHRNAASAVPSDPMDLSSLHLTKEGGHSHRRIIHATDATGKAVFETLQKQPPQPSKGGDDQRQIFKQIVIRVDVRLEVRVDHEANHVKESSRAHLQLRAAFEKDQRCPEEQFLWGRERQRESGKAV